VRIHISGWVLKMFAPSVGNHGRILSPELLEKNPTINEVNIRPPNLVVVNNDYINEIV